MVGVEAGAVLAGESVELGTLEEGEGRLRGRGSILRVVEGAVAGLADADRCR